MGNESVEIRGLRDCGRRRLWIHFDESVELASAGDFRGRTITFWQALGILVLSKILFSGFGGRPGHRGHWRNRMRDRWAGMTPEERERFRQGIHSRCGHPGMAPEEFREPKHV